MVYIGSFDKKSPFVLVYDATFKAYNKHEQWLGENENNFFNTKLSMPF